MQISYSRQNKIFLFQFLHGAAADRAVLVLTLVNGFVPDIFKRVGYTF